MPIPLLRRPRAVTVASLAVAALAATAACDSSTGVGDDVLRIEADGERLTLTTALPDTVYFFAADYAALPLLDWGPCTAPQQPCTRVWRGRPVEIPYSRFSWSGEGGGRDAYIAYWRLNPAPVYGIRGRIESRIVRLRRPNVALGR